MTYDRRNPILREQYNKIYKCLYDCPNNNTYIDYIYYEKYDCCLWNNIIENDKKKLGTLEKLTFPIVEVILKK